MRYLDSELYGMQSRCVQILTREATLHCFFFLPWNGSPNVDMMLWVEIESNYLTSKWERRLWLDVLWLRADTWKLQACNIWDDPHNTCGLLQAPTDNWWIANTAAQMHFHSWDSTCFHIQTGYFPTKSLLTSWTLHSTTNCWILQRMSDFLALLAWILLCHVFWTGLSIKRDGEHHWRRATTILLKLKPHCSPFPGVSLHVATLKILLVHSLTLEGWVGHSIVQGCRSHKSGTFGRIRSSPSCVNVNAGHLDIVVRILLNLTLPIISR